MLLKILKIEGDLSMTNFDFLPNGLFSLMLAALFMGIALSITISFIVEGRYVLATVAGVFTVLFIVGVLLSAVSPSEAKARCNVVGKMNWKSSHPKLKKGLCRMSRALGKVTVTSSCRTKKKNRGARKSYHLYSRGCKAADVVVKGAGRYRVLAWWKRNIGGGRGIL